MSRNPFLPSALTESVSRSPPRRSPSDDPTAGPSQSQPTGAQAALGSPFSTTTVNSGTRPSDDSPTQSTTKTLPPSDRLRSRRSLLGPSPVHRRDFAAKAPGMTRAGSGESSTSSSSSFSGGSGSATPNSESRSHEFTDPRSSNANGEGDDAFGPSHMTNLIKGFAGMVITMPSLIVEAVTNATSASVDAAQTVAQATSETTQNLTESTSNVVREGVDVTMNTAVNVKDKTVDAVEAVTNSPTTRATLGHRLSDWFNWSSTKPTEQDATVVMDESEILRAQLEQEIDRSFSGSKDEGIGGTKTTTPFKLGFDDEAGDAQPASSDVSNLERDRSSHDVGERRGLDEKGRSMEMVEDATLMGGLVKPSEATRMDKSRHSPQNSNGAKGLKQPSERSGSGEGSGKGKGRDEQDANGERPRGTGDHGSAPLRHSPFGGRNTGQQGQAEALQDFGRTASVQYQADASSVPASTQQSYAASSTSDQMTRPREVQQHAQENLGQPSHRSGGISPSRSVAPALPGHLQPSVWIKPHHEREEETTPARSSFDDLKERFAKYPSTEASEQEFAGVSAVHAQQPQQALVRRDSPPSAPSAPSVPSGSVGLAADHKQFEHAAPVDLARSDSHGTSSTAEHDGE